VCETPSIGAVKIKLSKFYLKKEGIYNGSAFALSAKQKPLAIETKKEDSNKINKAKFLAGDISYFCFLIISFIILV